MDSVDVVVIGAGVVGLACAKQLAEAGREVIVLERETAFGTGISARNSEVIHAGLYYPPGSLKAALCVQGRRALYTYCAERGIAHRRIGKLVVASRAPQLPALEAIAARARTNGVDDLRLLDGASVRALEPELDAAGGLFSPSTGIVDSHGLMQALLADAERHGAVLALASPVRGGLADRDGIVLEVGGSAPTRLRARCVINAAGLDAPRLGHALAGPAALRAPQACYARGVYFSLVGRAPFSHLIYPIPEPGGLGVHLTLDLGGQARFGPDVEWIETIDYGVDPRRADRFYAEVRKYWPGLPDDSLQPAYSGIRPKIAGPGAPNADFLIQGPQEHGIDGLVNLFGIESPGLTACLPIAAYVCDMLRD